MVRTHGSLLSIFAVVLSGCVCVGFDDTPEEITTQFTATDAEMEPYKDADGELAPEACTEACTEILGVEPDSCELLSYDPDRTDAYSFECTGTVTPVCKGGRRPLGLASSGAGEGADPVGRWLGELAHLEAASVPAFEQLAARLIAVGAPPELVAAARDAARDEVEHARVVTACARSYGAEPAKVRLHAVAEPDLEALALDNAVEGCVRETWGALLAWYQATHAEDSRLREAFAVIARDETRHAELARSIAQWLDPRLSPQARARVRAARDHAVAELRQREGLGLPNAARERLGLPPREVAVTLLDRLQPRLWAA